MTTYASDDVNLQTKGIRQLVRVAVDIVGTGIKTGMVGEIVQFQRGTDRGESFTTLAPTAYLIRFTKKSLADWIIQNPNQHAPIGAEIWMREGELANTSLQSNNQPSG